MMESDMNCRRFFRTLGDLLPAILLQSNVIGPSSVKTQNRRHDLGKIKNMDEPVKLKRRSARPFGL